MSILSLITGSFRKNKITNNIFVENETYEKGFTQHYEKYLKPHIASFEKKRMQALQQASKRIKISIPLLLIIITIILLFFILTIGKILEDNSIIDKSIVDKSIIMLFFIIGLFILARWWVYQSINKYTKSIKSDVFPNIISFFGDYKYSPECKDRVYNLKDSSIIPPYDRETNEDAIIGSYKNVKISLFESNLEIERQSQDRTYYESIFKGIVITLSMHKNFNGKTIVSKQSKKIVNLDIVKLEDPNFNKIFKVYSSDQVEARYLLTTSFMERLLQLSKSFEGKKLECSFYNNELLILIPVKKNLFEPGSIYKAEDFIDDSKKLLKEMNLIFQIIDILKLNQNIGM